MPGKRSTVREQKVEVIMIIGSSRKNNNNDKKKKKTHNILLFPIYKVGKWGLEGKWFVQDNKSNVRSRYQMWVF